MSKPAYIAGVIVQGLVLGALLFVALTSLLATASGVRLFRYQEF